MQAEPAAEHRLRCSCCPARSVRPSHEIAGQSRAARSAGSGAGTCTCDQTRRKAADVRPQQTGQRCRRQRQQPATAATAASSNQSPVGGSLDACTCVSIEPCTSAGHHPPASKSPAMKAGAPGMAAPPPPRGPPPKPPAGRKREEAWLQLSSHAGPLTRRIRCWTQRRLAGIRCGVDLLGSGITVAAACRRGWAHAELRRNNPPAVLNRAVLPTGLEDAMQHHRRPP